MKKISVIVPIYKVEKYIHRCIDSIINQTYKNLEIILVDDGSPDSCPRICDEYAKKDKRIKVIHKENGGLSDARNKGVDIATGDYIAFVDSDDYIHPNMYEVLIYELEKNNSDIALCKYKIVYEKSKITTEIDGKFEVYSLNNLQALDSMYGKDGVDFIVAWNKLYKKDLFNKIRYPVGKIHEDEYTTYKLLFASKNVIYIEYELYYFLLFPHVELMK